ncbi:hypothetical protein MTBPR1_100044 [Candidatus Terasakiella magnetica]|uniref:Uncharacterized protein n=1 Tax=Candidatus Terasakiella magnetica TaxID=1867952 RepID=A0A1C3RDN4_9PROT|nr:hypothetical protein [Candidatus Terasakiella magnetica]SCA55403.1 hypothetical protein MTBPR1_100044 [Candidatus Terasakiella magnetica]
MTLKTNRIEKVDGSAGVDTDYLSNDMVSGVAKAWAHYDQSGANTIVQSFNVSSMVDNGTGNASLYYTSPLAQSDNVGTSSCTGRTHMYCSAARYDYMRFYVMNNSHAYADTNSCMGMIHGDLA